MQIAIASTDGKTVNSHFGHADTFYIYKQSDSSLEFIEKRAATPYAANNPKHSFNEESFNRTVVALSECSKVLCTKIGDKPKEELGKRGIEVIIYTGAIEDYTNA